MLPEIEQLATVVVCDDEPTRQLLCDHLTADRYARDPGDRSALLLAASEHGDELAGEARAFRRAADSDAVVSGLKRRSSFNRGSRAQARDGAKELDRTPSSLVTPRARNGANINFQRDTQATRFTRGSRVFVAGSPSGGHQSEDNSEDLGLAGRPEPARGLASTANFIDLITRRSRVQIPPPLPHERPGNPGSFAFFGTVRARRGQGNANRPPGAGNRPRSSPGTGRRPAS